MFYKNNLYKLYKLNRLNRFHINGNKIIYLIYKLFNIGF